MCLRAANVEDGRLAGVLEVLELCGRANEWSLVERDDASSRRWTRCRERGRCVDERLRVTVLEFLVRALLVADRRGVIWAHRRTAQRAGDVPGVDLVRIREFLQSL